MKRLSFLLLIGIVLISLAACQVCTSDSGQSNNHDDYITTPCTKDSVDELMSMIGEVELGGLSAGMKLDTEHCYNVTPISVTTQTDIKYASLVILVSHLR